MDYLIEILGWIAGILSVAYVTLKSWLASRKPGEFLFGLLFRGKSKLQKIALGADAARIAKKFAMMFKYDIIDENLDEMRQMEQYMDAALKRLQAKHPGG